MSARAHLLKQDWSAAHSFDRDRFRELFVELTPELQFRVLEVRHPPRGAYWSKIWPTSVAVSQWLLARPRKWFPQTAIEIGCGLGLVSLTLAHLNVVIEGTDREPQALLLTEEAGAFNSLSGLTTGALEWSSEPGPATSLLVGADVMYERSSPQALFSLIHSSGLLASRGVLVLGTPRRRHTYLDSLVDQLKRVGYQHEVTESKTQWKGKTEGIDIHCLRRPSAAA